MKKKTSYAFQKRENTKAKRRNDKRLTNSLVGELSKKAHLKIGANLYHDQSPYLCRMMFKCGKVALLYSILLATNDDLSVLLEDTSTTIRHARESYHITSDERGRKK